MAKKSAPRTLPPDESGTLAHQLHIYYGLGKGKTTCCMGLILRALGAGHRVVLIQFDKGFDGENEHYAERSVLRRLEGVEVFPTGCERMMADGSFRFGAEPEDISEAKRGLDLAKACIDQAGSDLLVLDEILAASAYGLLSQKDVMALLDHWEVARPCELVLSGHKVWDELVDRADLVTEMRKVKHYYGKGVPARKGIEF